MAFLLLGENQTPSIWPATIHDLVSKYPSTSFPSEIPAEGLPEFGLLPFAATNPPAFIVGAQKLVETAPELVEGQWTQSWSVLDLDDDEKGQGDSNKAQEVRRTRNELLARSDWTQLADAPSDNSAWALYRQELRDITAQEGFPWNVNWPEQPQ